MITHQIRCFSCIKIRVIHGHPLHCKWSASGPRPGARHQHGMGTIISRIPGGCHKCLNASWILRRAHVRKGLVASTLLKIQKDQMLNQSPTSWHKICDLDLKEVCVLDHRPVACPLAPRDVSSAPPGQPQLGKAMWRVSMDPWHSQTKKKLTEIYIYIYIYITILYIYIYLIYIYIIIYIIIYI